MTRWLARFAIIGLGLGTLRASPSQAQWVERPGTGWVQVQAVYHRTNTRFGPEGSIEPLFNEGSRSITTSVFLTTAIGLVPGLDAWAQLPAHRLQFNDVVRDRTSTGLGDPRLFLRASLQAFGLDLRVPIAVRGGVKLPVGDFPIDAEVIPLSEGQRDWELLVELGHSFYPAPVYVMGWAGYRWRETNEAIARKPGDEWLAYVAAGGTVRDLHLENRCRRVVRPSARAPATVRVSDRAGAGCAPSCAGAPLSRLAGRARRPRGRCTPSADRA